MTGERALLTLRITMIFAVVWFVATGILTDPDILGIDSEFLDITAAGVWVLPGVTGLVAVILCHRPAHRQVPWLTHSIFGCGWAAVVVGAIGVVAGFYGAPLALVALCVVAVVCGVATLVLQYTWRAR